MGAIDEKRTSGEQLPDLLTVPEAATYLRSTPGSVRNMIGRGQLPGVVRIGRKVLIRSRDLRAMLGV